MSSAPNAQQIARDARWLVQALDPKAGVVRLVEMDREAYRQASFLDDRMFQRPTNAQLVPWAVAADAAALVGRDDARWIFHISHVGSTLLARLLGEIPGALSIREPQFLRDMAMLDGADREASAKVAQKLFSRTFSADETALIKTTSTVSEMAPELVPPGGRALFMYVGPRAFLATILAGEQSLREIQARAEERERRLRGRDIVLPQARHVPDLVAAAWACEMTSLEAAAEAMDGRQIRWVDFDVMLQDVQAELMASAESLGFAANPHQLAAIANGPLMTRYSKALEHGYSPALRHQLMEDAISRHRREIDDALAMLERTAEKSPLLARALARSGEA